MGPKDLIREEILALAAYHVPPATGFIKLDAMENPYLLPEPLRERVAGIIANTAINRYPDAAAVALKAKLREVMHIPAVADILVGNGSDEIIRMVTTALARPGAIVLTIEPTFVMYKIDALISRMQFVGVPLESDFTLDIDKLLAAIAQHQPALVWISYPNNPTGNLFPEADIERILRAAPGLVVLDEAYHIFADKTFMNRLPEFPNLMVMRTMSKAGLAGLRLGYAAAAPEWIAEFDKVRPPYNVNSLTQSITELLLDNMDALEEQAAAIKANRLDMLRELDAIPGVTAFHSSANFILIRVPDSPATFAALKASGVLIKNLHGAHPLLTNCLRLTLGTPAENTTLLSALRTALKTKTAA